MPLVALRERVTLDSIPNLDPLVITFHHPGYPDDVDGVLFRLYGFDGPERGLHHRTAWLACAIVAGNAWQGFLTPQPSSTPRLTISMDEALTESDYWFHVPNPDPLCLTPYPVVPSFRDWRFPHKDLPSWWRHLCPKKPVTYRAPSNLSGAVKARDGYCRITQCRDYTDTTHICPRSECSWFRLNKMRSYNANYGLPDSTAMDDETNALLLRRDLHAGFDDKMFVIVPKGGNSQWVVHMIHGSYEFGKLYHNVPLHDISIVAVEFLLARFAWAIFPLLGNFLTTNQGRWVIRCKAAEGENPSWMAEWVDGSVLRPYIGESESRSRSQSPKRGRRGIVVRENGSPGEGSTSPVDEGDTTIPATLNDPALTTCPPSSETEYEGDSNLMMSTAPHLVTNEVFYSDDNHRHTTTLYPGRRKIDRLKESWLRMEREKSGTENWNKANRKVQDEPLLESGEISDTEIDWEAVEQESGADCLTNSEPAPSQDVARGRGRKRKRCDDPDCQSGSSS